MANKKTYIIIAIILIILFIGLYFNTDKKPKSSDYITIGSILPLSGKAAQYGNEIKNAIELAKEEINANGGINGKLINIIYEDDAADPNKGVNAMQKLINIDKVKVVLGSWVSGVVVASAPIAEQSKVIVMAEAISPTISSLGDYIFRIQPSATQYTKKLAEKIAGKGYKKWAAIYINNEFGHSLYTALSQELDKYNIKIEVAEQYDEKDGSFYTQLTKIKQYNPEVIFIGGYQEQKTIIKQIKELGIDSLILAGPPFENKSIIDDLGSYAEGVVYPYHFYKNNQNPKTIEYLQKYKNKFEIESGGFAPLMYDAVHIIANSLKQCELDTDCIKKYLYSVEYEGISGKITFDKNGDPVLPIIIKTVKNGEFVKYK